MGSFANTVFSLLLGWLQTLTSVIWSALTDKGSESFFEFIGKNWLIITILLSSFGLITDFIVYLYRWEPYKVWRSAWRKLRYKEEGGGTAEEELTEAVNNTCEPEGTESNRKKNKPVYAEQNHDKGSLDRCRESPQEEENRYVPEEVTNAGYHVPYNSPYKRPSDNAGIQEETDRSPRSETGHRRRRLNSFLGDQEEEMFHYFAPKPIIDEKEAYHTPVYPERWNDRKEQKDDGNL